MSKEEIRFNRIFLALCLITSVFVAGCVPRGDAVRIEFDGSIDRTTTEFHMQGVVVTSGGIPDREVYRNISLKFYSEDGTLLYEKSVGDLKVDSGGLKVSISANIQPMYIVISSSDFYNEPMAVEYYEWDGRKYVTKYATTRSDFPINDPITSARH